MTQRISYGLCGYSMPHKMGYLKTKDGESCPNPMSPLDLMDAAVALGLSGVEFPLSALVPSFDGKLIETAGIQADIKAELAKRDLKFVADYGVMLDNPAEHLTAYLTQAAETGAKVVRMLVSHLLCGDRRRLEGGWERLLEQTAEHLKRILPHAEHLGIAVAVENHQDLTSGDILHLYERTGQSPAFGITLDTGNPLAVGEDPVDYTRRIAPLIRHVHLKDYTIHFAPEGWRLVRCAAGEGCIDFPGILARVRENGHTLLPAIEIAAQATRTVPLLEDDWWEHYPVAQREYLPAALKVLWQHGRPQTEPYSSAWERGENSETVSAEEWDIVQCSTDYFRRLGSI